MLLVVEGVVKVKVVMLSVDLFLQVLRHNNPQQKDQQI